METEAQAYLRLLDDIIARVERRIETLESFDELDAGDEIELSALDHLLEDLEGLNY